MINSKKNNPVFCCCHVRHDNLKARIIIKECEYVKISCEKNNHLNKDYSECDLIYLNKMGFLRTITDMENGQQARFIDGQWITDPSDRVTLWTDRVQLWADGIPDQIIQVFLDLAQKVYLNGGVWILRSKAGNGIGSIKIKNDTFVKLWIEQPYLNCYSDDVKSKWIPEFIEYENLITDFIADIDQDYILSLCEDDIKSYINFYPVDLARFLIWASTGEDPASRVEQDAFLES